MSEDLYGILGVSRDASPEDIKRAYKKLARKHHPDLNPGDAAAEERFKKLSFAYEVLNDAEKRALYDEFGEDAEKIGYDPERAKEYREWKRRAEAAQSYGGFDFGGGGGGPGYVDIEDLLGDLFRGRGRGGPRKGRDFEAQLRVSFMDAARGSSAHVDIGGVGGRVSIPAGIESGQRLRLEGKGGPGHEGGPPGDLYVRIEVEPHPLFTREGLDLGLVLPVTVAEALAGGSVDVPTLGGSVSLKIPPGAANGQKMRLRGKGIEKQGGAKGDLIVTLEVVMPAGGDDATRKKIAAELEALYEGQDVRRELRR